MSHSDSKRGSTVADMSDNKMGKCDINFCCFVSLIAQQKYCFDIL